MHRGSALRRPLAVPALLQKQAAAAAAAAAREAATAQTHAVSRPCLAADARAHPIGSRRGIQISAAPATEYPKPSSGDAFSTAGGRDDADARFEVLGSPYSLLSVSLSASQNLYTRRGTLVSVAGKVENAQSTLALMTPVRRALLGIPFLYQRITSTTPVTLLIGTKSATTTLFTLRLDGTTDWVVAQRSALLAWTGHALTVTPRRHEAAGAGLGLGLAHWGTSFVTGRGLVALAAPGYIYPITLAAGESLAVHPSHVVAYAAGAKHAPHPFRFRTAKGALAAAAAVTTRAVRGLHLQTPAAAAAAAIVARLPPAVVNAWHAVRDSAASRALGRALYAARTLLRQSVWGDRLFVHVQGPATLLLSSRGVRVADALTRAEVDEIADAEPGAVRAAVDRAAPANASDSPVPFTVATATDQPAGAKVELADTKDLKAFVR